MTSRSVATIRTKPTLPPSYQIAPSEAIALRTLYWENVVREMLTELSVASMNAKNQDIFDGRFAVLTHAGERIPIAAVSPVFACGLPGSESEKALSLAVECTVFRVRAPEGEVFTLPLSQIRGIHTLSAELLESLEKQAMNKLAENQSDAAKPFGLAAFTHAATQDEQAAKNAEKHSSNPA